MSTTSRTTRRTSPSGLLDAQGAAAYLGVTVETIRNLTRRGEVPCVRLSQRNTRWHIDDLDDHINRLRGRA